MCSCQNKDNSSNSLLTMSTQVFKIYSFWFIYCMCSPEDLYVHTHVLPGYFLLCWSKFYDSFFFRRRMDPPSFHCVIWYSFRPVGSVCRQRCFPGLNVADCGTHFTVHLVMLWVCLLSPRSINLISTRGSFGLNLFFF